MPTYDELLANYSAEFHPHNQHQQDLCETLARSKWNLQRLRIMEDGVWEALFHTHKGADPAEAFLSDCTGSKVFDKLQRYIQTIQRNYDRALRELTRIVAQAEINAKKPADTGLLPKLKNDADVDRYVAQIIAAQALENGAENATESDANEYAEPDEYATGQLAGLIEPRFEPVESLA